MLRQILTNFLDAWAEWYLSHFFFAIFNTVLTALVVWLAVGIFVLMGWQATLIAFSIMLGGVLWAAYLVGD